MTNPGTIDLTWRKTTADYTKYNGTTETKLGPQVVMTCLDSSGHGKLKNGLSAVAGF